MQINKKMIPNPNKLSNKELSFLKEADTSKVFDENKKESPNQPKEKFKPRLITLPAEFDKTLNEFLKNNPTEGNRSNLMVRVIADYIKSKSSMY